ncbi:MAG: cytochrome c oxidase subunit 2A [Ilumatobacteraceae bacterium]
MTSHDLDATTDSVEEHFTPKGTVFILVLFVAMTILLWASVYVILLSRGVTV